jgi:hypothetical protein
VLGVAGQVDLAVLADDAAGLVDQDRGVEAPPRPFGRQLGIAQVEADAERAARRTAAASRRRHLRFEEGVDLGLVSNHQRGKKVVSASSGKTTRSQPRACAWRSSREHARDHLAAGVGALDRAELGGADGDDAGPGGCLSCSSAGLFFRQLQQGVQQHVGAGDQVFGRGVLAPGCG